MPPSFQTQYLLFLRQYLKQTFMLTNKLYLKYLATILACFVASIVFLSCSKSSDKQIAAFKFTQPPAIGEIFEGIKAINVEVPVGTDVSSLIPEISYSPKATLSPAAGIATDFTLPVTYTVTAEDGSTAQYKVTVTTEVDIVGKWLRTSDQMGIYIDANEGTFYQMGLGIWGTLFSQGKLNMGDIKFKDITKTGKLTWKCQDLLYTFATETFSWSDDCKLTLSATGNTLTLTGTTEGHSYTLIRSQ